MQSLVSGYLYDILYRGTSYIPVMLIIWDIMQVASVFYEEVTKKMLGAFEGRLKVVYGPSSMMRGPKSVKAVA